MRRLEAIDAIAPPLLWPEVRSVLHVTRWRGLIEDDDARAGLDTLESAPIAERRPRMLGREAWRIADEMGWRKTYDAEYLALASLAGAGIATRDRRLHLAAERLSLEVIRVF